MRYLVDPRVAPGTAWVTGADEADHHVVDLVAGRDFTPDGTVEAAEVRAGDPSPDGTGVLEVARGIEIGHIFQLGRKYADAFGLDAHGADGQPVRITMGSYGIGISRLVAVIAEQRHDERGLVWPRVVAPFDVHVVVAGRTAELHAGGEALAAELEAAGLSVLLDERPASPGVKFADAELIGVPTIVVVGRGLAAGTIEVEDRRTRRSSRRGARRRRGAPRRRGTGPGAGRVITRRRFLIGTGAVATAGERRGTMVHPSGRGHQPSTPR